MQAHRINAWFWYDGLDTQTGNSWKGRNVFGHLHVQELICKCPCKDSVLKTSENPLVKWILI